MWFFRNKNGGCAYFDALGKPWPLHPCMELQQRTADRMAAAEAARLYAQSSPVAGLSPTFAQTRRAVVDGPTSAARSTYLPTAMAAMRMHPRSSTERAPQTTIADYVLSWWTVMSRLIAVCAVLVVAMVLLMQAGFLSTLLLAWLIIVPCAIQGLAYAAFLLLVPPPRGSTEVTIKVCLMVPLFAAQTALSSVVTLGIGPVAHAVRVLKEIPWAQAAASSSTYSTRAVPRQ